MLLGVFCSTLTGIVLGMNPGAVANGIYGYNGTLLGIGISLYHFGGDNEFFAMPQIIISIIILSIFSAIFMAGIGTLFLGKFGISPLTLPFVLLLWIWLLGASGHRFAYFPVNGTLLNPHLITNPMSLDDDIKTVSYRGDAVIESFFKGISYIYFQSNTISGIVILVGIFICSPISAFCALMGSAISTLTAMGLGVSSDSIYTGEWGFSAAMTSVAIGGLFFVLNNFKVVIYTLISVILTTIVHGGVESFLAPIGIPPLNFPFNFVCWIFCLAGQGMKGVFTVDITAITIPENHIKMI
jgi:urea transporter